MAFYLSGLEVSISFVSGLELVLELPDVLVHPVGVALDLSDPLVVAISRLLQQGDFLYQADGFLLPLPLLLLLLLLCGGFF